MNKLSKLSEKMKQQNYIQEVTDKLKLKSSTPSSNSKRIQLKKLAI